MKKVFAFAIVALSLVTSCSSDDSLSVTEEKLVKKWYFKSSQANGQTEVYDHLTCGKDYIEFLPDGNYSEYYVNECNPTSAGTETGNWDLEGNTVFVSLSGNSFSGKVTELSSTKLQITLVADYDDDGDTENVKVNFTNN